MASGWGRGFPMRARAFCWASRARGHNTPTYQHIQIDGARLTYTAYTALGEAYDAFALEHINGNLVLINGDAAFGDPRSYENTGPRVDHDWLR